MTEKELLRIEEIEKRIKNGVNIRKKTQEELNRLLDKQTSLQEKDKNISTQITQQLKKRLNIAKQLNGQTSTAAELKAKINNSETQLLRALDARKKAGLTISAGMEYQLNLVESLGSGMNDIKGINESVGELVSREANVMETLARVDKRLLNSGQKISKERREQLEKTRETLSEEKEMIDTSKKILEARKKEIQALNERKAETTLFDKLTGGLVSKAKDFAKSLEDASPKEQKFLIATAALAAGIVVLKKLVSLGQEFAKTFDSIGKQFGSINLIGGELQNKLLGANIEAKKLGGNIDDVSSIANNLASNFGFTLDEATDLSIKIFDTSKALGLSTDEGANLFGVLTQTANLSAQQAEQLSEGAAQLARQRGVAPQAVLRDIASSAETIAEFTKDGGNNIAEAAIQARSLGVSLETSAKVAKSLLDFESSVAAEVEASVLLGRQLNFQKARELALNNNITGAMADVVAQLGSEEEFNKLNLIQREALAKSIGVSTAELAKFVGESQKANEAGSLAGQSFKDLVGEDALSAFTRLSSTLASIGAQLAQSVGPALGVVAGAFASVLGYVSMFVGWLDEAGALMPMMITALGGLGVALTATGVKFAWLAGKALLSSYAGIASMIGQISATTLGVGSLVAIGLAGVIGAAIKSQMNEAKTMASGFQDSGIVNGKGSGKPPGPKDTVKVMAKPGELLLNEAHQANLATKINTQQIVQNPVGFTEQQAITMGKIIGSQISLKADVENNKLAIAVDSATQPMAGKPLTS